ncbi:hypothetical protein KCP69_04575 [Salmonella enterica subsp. enterica]|nr:hypothetical protein KCP69_04575 [Salmonella enterica subsp. enterica]
MICLQELKSGSAARRCSRASRRAAGLTEVRQPQQLCYRGAARLLKDEMGAILAQRASTRH